MFLTQTSNKQLALLLFAKFSAVFIGYFKYIQFQKPLRAIKDIGMF